MIKDYVIVTIVYLNAFYREKGQMIGYIKYKLWQLEEVAFVDFINWSRVLHKATCHSLTVLVIIIPS